MNQVERIRHYLRHAHVHREELLSYAGVHHFDVGWRYVGGKRADRLAIRVFVLGRKRGHGSGRAPRRMRGISIDVITTPSYRRHCAAGDPADPSRLWAERLQGGLSVGTQLGAPLTLGLVVRRSDQQADHLITAIHAGTIGSDVFSPAPPDAPGGRRLGQVVDADEETALVRIDDPTEDAVGAVLGLPLVRDWVKEDELPVLLARQASLMKSGRTTAVTRGVMDGISGGAITVRRAPGSPELACGGDSGSIWMTDDGRAVGMHYGGDGKVALAWAMHRICDRFDLRVS